MSAILENLLREHGDDLVRQLTSALNVKQDEAKSLVTNGVPVIMAGLRQQKTQEPNGENQLAEIAQAVGGSDLLNQLGSIFGGEGASQPEPSQPEPMKKFLGNTEDKMTHAISKKSGLDNETIQKALLYLIPIVISAIVKFGSQAKAAEPAPTGSQPAPGADENALGALGSVLDRDGDGSFLDDLLEMAGNAGGSAQSPSAGPQQSQAGGGLLGGILKAVLGKK